MPIEKSSFIFVSNEYCFEITDQNLNAWNYSLSNITCRTSDYSTLPYESEFCFSQIFREYGFKNLQVFCNEQEYNFEIYVTKLDIIMDKFEKPTFSSDYLNISFTLLYNETNELVSAEGQLEIGLELRQSPIETQQICSGTVTKGSMKTKFSNGKAEFKMINILSNGYFIIAPYCESFIISPSPSFSVTNFIKNVSLVTIGNPVHFSWLEVQLRIIGDDGLEFVRETDIDVGFNNFYCPRIGCSHTMCWNCLPMRINETVSVVVVDRAHDTFRYHLIYNCRLKLVI